MKTLSISNELQNNSYPGRGIIIGSCQHGKKAVVAYFIMGRSVNSRNRVFTEKDGGIITEAFDPALLSDPSLVIYAPVRILDNKLIVTNGDQTDTVYDMMSEGASFEDSLRTRTFEPDAPNFTPRISGIVEFDEGAFTYKMSILKSRDGDENHAEKFFFDFTAEAGVGHFIHTYKCDGDPRIPSFEGEPERIELKGKIDEFTNELWNSLNADNKVSLFVRYIDIETGEEETRIVNKNV
ncbi:MAG: IMP cyclohydrolase [Clostridia bacterium]